MLSQKFPLSIYITLSHFERLLLPCRCSLNATRRMLMQFRNIYQEPTCIKGRAWNMPCLRTPTISYLVNPFQFVAGLQHTVPSLSLLDSCPADSSDSMVDCRHPPFLQKMFNFTSAAASISLPHFPRNTSIILLSLSRRFNLLPPAVNSEV